MHRSLLEILRAMALPALVAGALAAGTACAQAAPSAQPGSEEAGRLGQEVATDLFSAMDVKAVFASKAPGLDHIFDQFNARPEWSGLMKQAALEELDHDLPALEQMIGNVMAKTYTVEELRAGTAFFREPAGKAFLAAMGAKSRGEEPPPMSKDTQRSAERFMSTPAGRGFMNNLSHSEDTFKLASDDFVAVFVPGTFIRFGQKAQAAEAARAASN